ncbi:MAG: hypothetical protein HOG12_08110 [Alphaproteobacteria bacterium]|jgi:hypothetical protein|nr:hypothetical protein [Alphaproteobacteria bacterium]
MVVIRPFISEGGFQRISETVSFIDGCNIQAFRTALWDARCNYWQIRLSQTGENRFSEPYPSLKELRDWLDKIERSSNDYIEFIEHRYEYEFDDGGEAHVEDGTPHWFEPLIDALRNSAKIASEMNVDLRPKVKRGKDEDLAFPHLIRDLANLFQKVSGKRATSNKIGDEFDADSPSSFQCFVEACAVEFNIDIITTFHQKTHVALIAARKLGKVE